MQLWGNRIHGVDMKMNEQNAKNIDLMKMWVTAFL